MAYSREQLMSALRNADSAGDTEGAKRIAAMIQSQPQEAPAQGATVQPEQQPQESNVLTDTAKSMGRVVAGGVSDLANVGVGIGNSVLSAADWATGDNLINYRIPAAGYGDADQYVQPQTTGEKVLSGAVPFILGGEVAAPLKAAEGAGRLARAGVSVLNQLPAAVAGSLSENNQANDAGKFAGDVALNATLPGVVEKVGGTLVRGARNILPEALGGFTQAEKAAVVANPDYVAAVQQGGNQAAQDAYRTATTDANGNVILTPSQTMNTVGGGKYIAAEQRDLTRGDQSVYNPLREAQASGEGLGRAVDANATGDLQQSAQDITSQFKQQSTKLYNDGKQQAQDILDSAPVKITELKFPDSKAVADSHLADHAKTGVGLTGEARRTLNQFQKSKISNIDDLDLWKRTLSEKAQKAYRAGDHQSAQALRETLNSLRGEADKVITKIDPNAGSIYHDADQYFGASVGDFGTGKKSVLGKISDNANPDTAANALVRGQNAAFNTNNVADALDEAISTGSLDNAASLATQFGEGLGTATRGEAYRAATTGENFSNTKFVNTLNRLDPQAAAASRFSADEQAVNNALRDAVNTTRTKAAVSTPLNSLGSQIVGRSVGGTVGSIGGIPGAVIGQEIGGRAASAISGGLIDRLMGTTAKAQRYIQFLSDPANAKAVSDVLANQGGLNASTDAIIRTVDSLAQSGATGNYATVQAPQVSTGYTAPAPIEPEPVQHAQTAKAPDTQPTFEPKITRLYKALANAETGNLDNRFIRTKAAESGVSTAYGPAQLTTKTMGDFYDRHSDLFTDSERDYIHRFIEQGHKMRQAANNDPVYGYGGTGVLGSKEDQRLYAHVTRKMINQMVKDNGGSLDKTVKQWRGNDKDHGYFAKVLAAYRAA